MTNVATINGKPSIFLTVEIPTEKYPLYIDRVSDFADVAESMATESVIDTEVDLLNDPEFQKSYNEWNEINLMSNGVTILKNNASLLNGVTSKNVSSAKPNWRQPSMKPTKHTLRHKQRRMTLNVSVVVIWKPSTDTI